MRLSFFIYQSFYFFQVSFLRQPSRSNHLFSVTILLVALEGVIRYSFQYFGTFYYNLFTVPKLYHFKHFLILEKEKCYKNWHGDFRSKIMLCVTWGVIMMEDYLSEMSDHNWITPFLSLSKISFKKNLIDSFKILEK